MERVELCSLARQFRGLKRRCWKRKCDIATYWEACKIAAMEASKRMKTCSSSSSSSIKHWGISLRLGRMITAITKSSHCPYNCHHAHRKQRMREGERETKLWASVKSVTEPRRLPQQNAASETDFKRDGLLKIVLGQTAVYSLPGWELWLQNQVKSWGFQSASLTGST